MVRVIRENRLPKWVGQRVSCKDCKSELEIEATDVVRPWSSSTGMDYFMNRVIDQGEVRCPVCGDEVRFDIEQDDVPFLVATTPSENQ